MSKLIPYHIAKWHEVYERAESRKLKALSWVAIPTSFSSHGYQCLLDEFGDDAPAMYGAWCALVSVAASCTVRGKLVNGRGIPLPISHIARMTGFPATVFERLIAWAARDEIGWLVEATPDFQPENDISGESPDDPPTIPRHVGEKPRIQDKTGQDQSSRTTKTVCAREEGQVVVPEVDQDRSSSGVDFTKVAETCRRLRKHLRSPAKVLIVEAAVVDAMSRRDFAGGLIQASAAGTMRRPSAYIRAAIDRHVREHRIDPAAVSRAIASVTGAES